MYQLYSQLRNAMSLTPLWFSETLRVLCSNMGSYPYSRLGYSPTSATPGMTFRAWQENS
jgi:hypothetical protein